ncbi:hypothetical protein UK99_01325 [Frankia casuarinae]|uniref:hypothetical protein n=1 Tax=Frankia casuarinae (strain DSM 45818 / CECT 9043 / HFP020203 / CcI3) TaxID=106370 RepID=UPI000A1220AA|nr:hypothetical protein [Frankia casuarinae]ORT98506.1 hypothetical protein UK99_01325 [Frankia casuarinae]
MPIERHDHHDRPVQTDGIQESDQERRRDEPVRLSLPFDGRLPSWVFLIAAALALALLIALVVTPLT